MLYSTWTKLISFIQWSKQSFYALNTSYPLSPVISFNEYYTYIGLHENDHASGFVMTTWLYNHTLRLVGDASTGYNHTGRWIAIGI